MSLKPLEFYDENIPCLAACPVNTNAGMYVAAIADGEDEKAYLTARLPNPFASVCGRVCAAPCEDACRRGEIDRPIAIRALKRFVTEQFGTEQGADGAGMWSKVAAPPEVELDTSVGIVGAGPAGMACAHDLRKLGYQVTVYEATDRLGGAMWLGIPEYRLDRDVLAADTQAIVDLGVHVKFNTRLGTDISFDELRRRHDAVFLGIGATLGRGLDIEGGDADGVLKAIEFLINMNRGFEVEVGERVIVIGGGDVAMDAARTALRADDYEEARADEHQGSQAGDRPSMTEAFDAARTATRAGAGHVTIISLEDRDEMPAHDFEVEEAEHEGIELVHRRGPARITVENGQVTGLDTTKVLQVFNEEGPFRSRVRRERYQTFRGRHHHLGHRAGHRPRRHRAERPRSQPPPHHRYRLGHRRHQSRRGVGRWRRRQRSPHADRRHRRRAALGGRHPPPLRRHVRGRQTRSDGGAQTLPPLGRHLRSKRPG